MTITPSAIKPAKPPSIWTERHIQTLKRLTVGPATVQQICGGELSSVSVRGWLSHLVHAGLVRAERELNYITDAGQQYLDNRDRMATQGRVCNASSLGKYAGTELGYRGRV